MGDQPTLRVPALVKRTQEPDRDPRPTKALYEVRFFWIFLELNGGTEPRRITQSKRPRKDLRPIHHLPLHYAAASLAGRFIYLVIEASPQLRSAKAKA